MASNEKQILEFIARIVYNINGLSSELKLYFNQYITFHFQGKLSVNQIQDIENRKASKAFKEDSHIILNSASLSLEEKVWVIASLQLIQSESERLDDRIISRRIGIRAKELCAILGLENDLDKIAEERKRIETEIQSFQNRPTIKIPVSILPLTIDYALRWIVLMTLSYQGVKLGESVLMPFNFIFIPSFTLMLSYVIGRSHKKHASKLLESYGGEQKFKLIRTISVMQYTWVGIFLGTGVFIGQLMPIPFQLWPSVIGFVFYYALLLRFFRTGSLSENDLVRQLEKENLDTTKLTMDENDEVIVQLDTKINSATGRLEAYVLESALFGALSFSGFLQIIATELISFKDLENFASSIYSSSQAFISLDWIKVRASIEVLSSKESLFCLVSVESLICSIFFLAVIASRLRFSNIGDRIRTAINMAKAYNEKEETLHQDTQASEEKAIRLKSLTEKVNAQLHIADRVMDEITPVMTYMVYFRNAGIVVFIIILISSSLFITGALSWIFIGLVVSTLLYFNRDYLARKSKAYLLSARILFVKKDYVFFASSIAPIVIAYILRIFFQIRTTDFLISLGVFFLGFFVFLWLLIAAHVDEKFGEIEMNPTKLARWKLVKALVAILILITTVFISFQLEGARDMLLVNLLSISFLMFFVGYYLTKKWWQGIITGWVTSAACAGVVFKIIHLFAANEMITVAFIAYLVLIPVLIWKRKLFHQLLLRFCLVGFGLSAWYLPAFADIPKGLRIAYEHQTPKIVSIKRMLGNNWREHLLGSDINFNQGVAEFRTYKEKYQTKFGFNYAYERLVWEYSYVSDRIVEDFKASNGKDTTRLEIGLRAAQEMNSIFRLFQYKSLPQDFTYTDFLFDLCSIESNVLLAMERKEAAIQSLQSVLQYDVPDPVKDALLRRIKELQTH